MSTPGQAVQQSSRQAPRVRHWTEPVAYQFLKASTSQPDVTTRTLKGSASLGQFLLKLPDNAINVCHGGHFRHVGENDLRVRSQKAMSDGFIKRGLPLRNSRFHHLRIYFRFADYSQPA